MKAVASVVAMVGLVFALVVGPAGAGGEKRKAPKTGVYEAVPDVKPNESYQPGAWVLVKDGKKLVMVADPQYSGVFWPERGDGCNPYTAFVPGGKVPVSKTGKFRVKTKISIVGVDKPVSLDWKGHWTKPTKLEGTVRVAFDDCSGKVKWTGSRTGAVPAGTVIPE
jgi:hypothetical protein